MSQNIQHFEYAGGGGPMGHSGNTIGAPGGAQAQGAPQQIGVIQNFTAPAEGNQLSSKRSYENT